MANAAEVLVAEDDAEAARLFSKALAASEAERWPFTVGRVRLAQGKRLRRSRALSDSKAPLTAAPRPSSSFSPPPGRSGRARSCTRPAG
ncbi:hypothetical protein AB0N88_04910 [Streptomyces sp. NPDC093516]|uniref:hypothetical protein n=1 Tax=Streptomyces sp. NPDC093516 TaxID=3155304 RepID=UPI0034497DA4